MEKKHLLPTLELVEDVFTRHDCAGEGRMVRRLVEEIRAKRCYVPQLDLMMADGSGAVIGYAMFSRFPIEGKYEDELLLLSPVAFTVPSAKATVWHRDWSFWMVGAAILSGKVWVWMSKIMGMFLSGDVM